MVVIKILFIVVFLITALMFSETDITSEEKVDILKNNLSWNGTAFSEMGNNFATTYTPEQPIFNFVAHSFGKYVDFITYVVIEGNVQLNMYFIDHDWSVTPHVLVILFIIYLAFPIVIALLKLIVVIIVIIRDRIKDKKKIKRMVRKE